MASERAERRIRQLERLIDQMRDHSVVNLQVARSEAYKRGYRAGLSKRPVDDRTAYQRGYRASWASKR